jgi:oxygen-dependent protoporphyrinogen oxidase
MSGQIVERGARTVVVVGGGAAGLAAAVRLCHERKGPRVLLLESRDRLGGLLHTVVRDGFLIEEAADSLFLDRSTSMWSLCQQTGLDGQLVSARVQRHQAMILQGNRFRPVPSGFLMMAPTRFWPLMATRLLTSFGKLRLAMEPFISSNGSTDDESVARFACRRLGRQAYERLVQPLAEAIYGSDLERLSMAATMPRIVELERRHGSLFRAALADRRRHLPAKGLGQSNECHPTSRAPAQGMSSFVAAMAQQLPPSSTVLNTPVEQLARRHDGRWGIVVAGEHPKLLTVDGVILAAPANFSAQIVRSVHRQLARELSNIEYSAKVHVTLGYRVEQVKRQLGSIGYFLPRTARTCVRSLTLTSEKFPGRAPPGSMQLRITLADRDGRSMDCLTDDDLIETAAAEVGSLLGLQGTPHFRHIVRHRHALPQYTVGHLTRMNKIDCYLAECPGLALAGAAYRGVGVPQCVHSGELAAETVLQHLRQVESSD